MGSLVLEMGELVSLVFLVLAKTCVAVELTKVRLARSVAGQGCPAFEPFRCPEEQRCISIQYLCDGAADCSDGYDEDPRLCTAARRPPVEETSGLCSWQWRMGILGC